MAEQLTTLKIIENREAELKPLYTRMDESRDFAYGKSYKLMTFDGKKPLDRVVNVTTNWPAVFANAIINDLMGSIWQTVIESDGKLTDTQKHKIENFIEDNLAQADEQLIRRGYSKLDAFLANHVCIRSIIGVRWISQFDNGEYKIDCLPVDMRHTPWEHGNDGLNWVANRTFRSPARVMAQYEKELEAKSISVYGTEDLKMSDYWTSDKHEVWMNDRLFLEQKHSLEEPPFVIVIPASGFMLKDKGSIAHMAEDLFFLNRGLYNELSRMMSVEQTLAMEILFPPYEQEGDEAGVGDKPPMTGESKKVKKGELHKLLPRGDLNAAFRSGRVDIQRALQMGGVNDIDLGNVSQVVSAVWITEQSEIRNKLIRPRLRALADMRQGLSRMQIKQYQLISEKTEGKAEIELGVTGRKRKYTPKELGDPGTYTITNELMSQSKKQEIVNMALFTATEGKLPLELRLKDILKADDPAGVMRQLAVEEARRADPALGLFDMAIKYADEAAEIDDESESNALKVQSQMLTERCIAVIRQRIQVPQELPEGATVPEVKREGGGMGDIMSLLGGGTKGAAPPVPTEEE